MALNRDIAAMTEVGTDAVAVNSSSNYQSSHRRLSNGLKRAKNQHKDNSEWLQESGTDSKQAYVYNKDIETPVLRIR